MALGMIQHPCLAHVANIIHTAPTEQRIDPDFVPSANNHHHAHEAETLIVQVPKDGSNDLAAIYENNIEKAKEDGKSHILLGYICATVNKEVVKDFQTMGQDIKSLGRQVFGMTLQDCWEEIEASLGVDTQNIIAARKKLVEEAFEVFDCGVDRLVGNNTQMATWRNEKHTYTVIKRCGMMTAAGNA